MKQPTAVAAIASNVTVVAKKTDPQLSLKDLPLFERPDFENLLQPGAKKTNRTTIETKPTAIIEAEIVAKPPVEQNVHVKVQVNESTAGVELLDHRDKIVLKRNHLILAAILILILLVLTFGVGFMVARAMK